jgi:hypothetical protein
MPVGFELIVIVAIAARSARASRLERGGFAER